MGAEKTEGAGKTTRRAFVKEANRTLFVEASRTGQNGDP
jgi:hypothetical protein